VAVPTILPVTRMARSRLRPVGTEGDIPQRLGANQGRGRKKYRNRIDVRREGIHLSCHPYYFSLLVTLKPLEFDVQHILADGRLENHVDTINSLWWSNSILTETSHIPFSSRT